jgi:phosphoribosylformylglycinamidine synthase
MAQPHVLILRAPGTNCDEETAYAFQLAGAKTEFVHVNRWLETPQLVDRFQIVCIPGGFSYGDDIAAGVILAGKLNQHLAGVLPEFVAQDRLVLGICNGFQVLIKTGMLLQDESKSGLAATLTWNDSARFEDRWVHLKTDASKCVFVQGIRSIYLPVAHAEGKLVPADMQSMDRWGHAGQLAMRYTAPADMTEVRIGYPLNPNGSIGDVAGVCDQTGRMFGLMPHPERYVDPTHHPHWTRLQAPEAVNGRVIFENAVNYFN